MAIKSSEFNDYTEMIDNIYSYNPAFKNLYKVEIYCESNSVYNINQYFSAHCENVKFGEESLTLKRNDVTKNFQIEGTPYKWQDTLTITWRECDSWKVKKYHEDWMSVIYDKSTDRYKSLSGDEVKKLYRTIRVTLPKSQGTDYDDKNIIVFEGVIINQVPGIDLAWGQQSDVVRHSLNYYVKNYHWESEENV